MAQQMYDAAQVDDAVEALSVVLERLDRRRHTSPARLELAQSPAGDWAAMIMADPLPKPLCCVAAMPGLALVRLAEHATAIDWRRVRR